MRNTFHCELRLADCVSPVVRARHRAFSCNRGRASQKEVQDVADVIFPATHLGTVSSPTTET